MKKHVVMSLLLLPLLSFQGCAGDGSTLDPLGNPLGPPRLLVTPDAVSLTVDQGNTVDIVLQVQNVGGRPLVISAVESAEAWIDLQALSLPRELGPGETIDLQVTVGQPGLDAGFFIGDIRFSTNDVEVPVFSLQIALEVSVEILPFPATFGNIQTFVFSTVCTECHSGSNAPEGLNLQAGASFGGLVDVTSTQRAQYFRVEPFDPDDSYLIRKLEGGPDIAGGRMPLNRTPLPQDQIKVIRRWIANGAANN